ncbi:MAG: DUF4639 domain-containing protein [Clostridiales bacterium]|nr:DUF4639 domain-containing protein [Clostridiales bacterium]
MPESDHDDRISIMQFRIISPGHRFPPLANLGKPFPTFTTIVPFPSSENNALLRISVKITVENTSTQEKNGGQGEMDLLFHYTK